MCLAGASLKTPLCLCVWQMLLNTHCAYVFGRCESKNPTVPMCLANASENQLCLRAWQVRISKPNCACVFGKWLRKPIVHVCLAGANLKTLLCLCVWQKFLKTVCARKELNGIPKEINGILEEINAILHRFDFFFVLCFVFWGFLDFLESPTSSLQPPVRGSRAEVAASSESLKHYQYYS